MNKSYTPEAWEKSINMGGDPIIVAADKFVCQLNPYLDKDANHSLISAAPDLVEALIGMAKVSAANEELKEVQAGWRGSAKELDNHCNKVANEHWELHLTSFAHTALTKAGVLTKQP